MALENRHRFLYNAYQSLPSPLKQVVRRSYDAYIGSNLLGPSYKRDFVATFFDSRAEFDRYESEFERSDIRSIEAAARAEHARRTGHSKFAAINRYTHPRLYALVRKLQPATVVETGVCNGVSTLVMLTAMEENGQGALHSVDYPDPERLPDGEQPGWLVPDRLRDRWSLDLGLSQEVLPDLIEGLDSIDLFVHDTKAAILNDELAIVWPKLETDATVVADDVHASDVFRDIQRQYRVDAGFVAPNVGYLIKRE